jgi:membrane protease YdiL (CAAX protease family)
VITNDPSSPPNPLSVQPDPLSSESSSPLAPAPPHPWLDVLIAFVVWVGSVLLLLFLPVVAVIPYLISMAMHGQGFDAAALSRDKTFLFLSIISVIPAHVLTLLGVWLLMKKWWKERFWENLKLAWPPFLSPWQGVATCFVIAILLLGLGSLVVKFLGGGKTDLDVLIESSLAARMTTAFIAVATAPLVEEVIYRGVLYPAIQRLLGMGWSILVVTLMFAIVHVPQYKNSVGVIVVITILSVILTVVRAWTDKLLPSIVIHLIFNGLQALYLVLEPFIDNSPKVEPAPTLIMLSKVFHQLF